MKCPECGSEKLTWDTGVRSACNGVVDGRFKMNEIEGIFILGCDECSETVRVISSNQFLAIHLQEVTKLKLKLLDTY